MVTIQERIPTGVVGLDSVLFGGLIPCRSYLVRGSAGTGKTILGLHFLTTGAARSERVLFISLTEPEPTIRKNAAALGFDLEGVSFLDLSPTPEYFVQVETYDIFAPSEVERAPITRAIMEQVERIKPQRVFVDSMTQFRYLAPDPFQFRKQVLSFQRYLVDRGATVLTSSEPGPTTPDDDLQFISDGVMNLEVTPEGRAISVLKFRGSAFREGRHSMRLTDRGMLVFPRLVPEEFRQPFVPERVPSGVPELDELLEGGVERGTVTIISGPTGTGKTTVGLQFMKEAAGRGERSVLYSFEEAVETIVHRAQGINMPVQAMLERGTLAIRFIEPLRYTPDEFASLVRREVEEEGARIVMLDSLAGYRLALRGADIAMHLHALCRYLRNMGVTIFLVNEVETITGEFRATETGISFLADNIIFLRYMEVDGRLRKAIGVLKKRLSPFEETMRELEITRFGIKVGEPLIGLRGVLRGVVEPTQGRPGPA